MATGIQRLRYFDGEFLRSNDFTDEQSYHVAMRRRLNLALHRYGIVEGLILTKDSNSLPPLLFVSVSPGFAIDQQGREIFLDAPYALSTDNVLGRAGLQIGSNEVWLTYVEAASGLPTAGYQACDQPGQNTRWTEGFDIKLKPYNAPPAKDGTDPDLDLGGVRLGTLTLSNDPVNGWIITDCDPLERTYIGIRALSVISPDEVDTTDPFKIDAQNVKPATTGDPIAPAGYLDVAPGVFARRNMFVEQNLVVGDDFKLDKLPVPGAFPANGNVKVNGDLFLNGTFFGFQTPGGWMGLADYIQSLMPDVQTGTVQFDLSSPGVNTTGSTTVTRTTKLADFLDPPQVSVSIASFEFLQNNKLTALTSSASADAIRVSASAIATKIPPNQLQLEIQWNVSPIVVAGGVNELPLTNLRVTWTVVFLPKP